MITVAATDPRIAAVVAQIPFSGFPDRVAGRSTGDTLKLLGAIAWDTVRGTLGMRPYYIPMVGHPGNLAVTATPEAEEHVRTDPELRRRVVADQIEFYRRTDGSPPTDMT